MSPRVLLIDNFDSFTWNLVHLLIEAGARVDVLRSDRAITSSVERLNPSHLVISPGPKSPADLELVPQLIRWAVARLPLWGVCLGHQALGFAFGAEIVALPHPVHGRTSLIENDGLGLYAGLPARWKAARYHSLVVRRPTIPTSFDVDAWLADDPSIVMSMRHRELPVFGVQFHPESFLSEHGLELARRFLECR